MLAFCGGGGKNNLGQQSFLVGIIWHIFGDSYWSFAKRMKKYLTDSNKCFKLQYETSV